MVQLEVKQIMKVKFIKSQVELGKKKEREHLKTFKGDIDTIMQVVKDHLKKDPHYYSKIEKAGL